MNNILIDTGFWYGLYDQRDNYYHQANKLYEYLSLGQILIPYPTIYETINTRFAKNKEGIQSFEKLISKPNVLLIDDRDYKEKALELTFDSSIRLNKPYSLVDMILRLILSDSTLKIDFLLSFNPEDFFDVCMKRNIKILYE
jgi:predicted nucleic acid-binding protein